MRIVNKHFPRLRKYYKLFNRNNIKLSYSCMTRVNNFFRKHNSKIDKERLPSNIKTCDFSDIAAKLKHLIVKQWIFLYVQNLCKHKYLYRLVNDIVYYGSYYGNSSSFSCFGHELNRSERNLKTKCFLLP